MWSSWSFGGGDSRRCLVDSCASTIHACLVWGILLDAPTSRFLRRALFPSSFLAWHSRIHWNFQLSPRIFDGFFIFSIFRINKINASQSSSIIEFGLLDCPFLLFSFWAAFPILVHTSGHTFSGLVVAWMFVNLFPDHMYPFGGFSFNHVNFGNRFQNLINFDSRPHSNNRRYVFLATHQDLCK